MYFLITLEFQNLKALFSSFSKNKNKQYRQPGGFQLNQGGESQRAEQGVVKYYDSLVLKHSVLADGG